MAITVAIKHSTSYKYDKLVGLSPQVVRLKPAPHTQTEINAYSLNIYPREHFINWQQDPFGNYLARIVFPEKVSEFKIDVEVITELKALNPFDFFVEEYANSFPFEYEDDLKKELSPYLEIKEKGNLLMEWVEELKKINVPSINDFLVTVNQLLYEKLNYTIRLEHGVQACEETLEKSLGSCRDFAWVLVQAFRHIGLASRFVSGYLIQLKSDQKSLDGPSGPEEDFTDLHAWCEVYIPGAGWIGLDATSGLLATEGHIPLCCTPDAKSASPISGYLNNPANTTFSYSNKVVRIHEDPRVTKPYSEEQWEKIDLLGKQIDQKLLEGDARLTMGGEPTFVSRFDMESEQWNTDADGTDKRKMAFDLAENLKEKFGQKGLLHIGQGKWYPGEPLPRWQYSIFWRKDGLPIIRNTDVHGKAEKKYQYTFHHAEQLLNGIANQLNFPETNVVPAYEDVYYYLWQENQLPVNIDPLLVDLSDSLERRTLNQVLKHGLNNPVGFALPIEWSDKQEAWLSCRWEFREKHLYLTPGNSPMGLRLPLDTLPHMVKSQQSEKYPRSPFEDVSSLPDYHEGLTQQQQSNSIHLDSTPHELLHPASDDYQKEGTEEKPNLYVQKKKKEEKEFEPSERKYTVKTALSVEEREGKLYVYFPPIDKIEHYLELLAIIEKVAGILHYEIFIEGYEPPRDNRIEKLVVTPDPGVVEVNIQPASSWDEIVNNYSTLFEAAGEAGLGTEKFMLDGKHTGSGGGHHVTLGGITPSDSPLLRKPDVLKSLLIYWQNHPSLSYLFSTVFIGPTSQAPRVDEGKPDQLYNLEIALSQIKTGHTHPFWEVDRILRNQLVDLTGNTHRSEFCIDKLYSPDSSSGRLGILELRGFEMPPEKKLCLVQILLVRALFARFWKTPYDQRLIRWGTELHDKFMIHHFVKEDILEICNELKEAGLDFDPNWLEPFFEFRFPLIGKVDYSGIRLELRLGIEPWQVLGEEMSNNGTARFVDSSVERLEVKVTGINEERYAILCNGRQVPLQATGKHQEYVAGVRYKAWAPPSALHPTLEVDTPLVFDIYDKANKRSIGGCQYHVSHPGGRSYDAYPVNAVEAESRRENRFFNFGHTQQKSDVIEVFNKGESILDGRNITSFDSRELSSEVNLVNPDNEFPFTFDLRK